MVNLIAFLLISSGGDTMSLSLEAAERMALQHNPSLLAAEKTASSAGWSARGAIAGYLPQASISGSYSDANSYGGFGFDTSKIYSVTLSLTQSLFSPSGVYNILSSTSAAGQQRASYEHTRLQTVYAVDEAYFGLLKAVKTVEINQSALDRARTNLEVVQTRFQLEDASRAELARAEASVKQAEYELAVAEAGLITARANLAVLLGLDPATPIQAEDVVVDTSTALPEMDSLISEAMRRRQDLAQHRAATSSARAGYWDKLLSFLPELSLGYYWRYYDTQMPSFSNGLDDFRKSSGVYAQLNFNLSGYPFELAAQKDAVAAAEWQTIASRLAVQKDVQDAFQQLRNALDNYRLARASLQASQLAWQLTDAQFKMGAASQLEVADARQSLLQAELAASSAGYDLALARRKLEIAIGRLEVKP